MTALASWIVLGAVVIVAVSLALAVAAWAGEDTFNDRHQEDE